MPATITWDDIQEAIDWLNRNSEEELRRQLATGEIDPSGTSIPYMLRVIGLADGEEPTLGANIIKYLGEALIYQVSPLDLMIGLEAMGAVFLHGLSVGLVLGKELHTRGIDQ